MRRIQNLFPRLLRGRQASRLLRSLGIDPKRYWLLVDLFGQLSERGEMLDQLGANDVALRMVTWIYAVMFALMAILLVVALMAPTTYVAVFLLYTAFLLFFVLLSETGNSLVNPQEGLVLAHQPINGATYTAAKLTHLVRIILYLVTAMNAFPALAGVALPESQWFFPFIHLLVALILGLVAGLLCCALYGWLIRFMPAKRLKAAGQFAGTLPVLGFVLLNYARRSFTGIRVFEWLPADAWVRLALALGFGAAAAAIVAFGIRSLSADYLIRVSGIVHGGRGPRAGRRRSWTGDIVSRRFGGQPGRAGFAFVSRMMRRDYQFRRQMVPILVCIPMGIAPFVRLGWRGDPFSGEFTPWHLAPHMIGVAVFFMCSLLSYGNDYKGTWVFLLAPARVFGRFAQGIHAALWIPMIFVPHAIIALLFAWIWGAWHAGLFASYSLAISSLYLAVELRLIDSIPFSQQMDPKRNATLLPLVMVGGLAIAAAVGLQYFFVFRSSTIVAAVTVGAGAVTISLTRSSLSALETSMRYSLASLSQESGPFYTEIDL